MKKVLIVDNDLDVLDVLNQIFEYYGFEVKSVMDIDNIFPLIAEYQPDIVLMDYILNGINGGEICHQIKVNTETSHIPVVIVSAYTKVLQSLGYYGCDAFIPKPFDMDDLVGQVNGLILQKAS
jgi:CheY-like chemotaxis protein